MFGRAALAMSGMVAAWAAGAVAGEHADVADRLQEGRPPVIIAHRTARPGGFPELSLAAIGHAIGLGVDMVHLNPQLTRDGHYVLMHDPTLNRTTDVVAVFPGGAPGGPDRAARGGRDYVRDYPLEAIRRLTLTDGEDGGTHGVPTLEEALDLAEGRVLVLLGLKTFDADSLVAVLAGRDSGNLMMSELFVSATDPAELFGPVKEMGVAMAVALVDTRDARADLDRVADAVGPSLKMVCVKSRMLTPAFLDRMRELGLTTCLSGHNGHEDSALIYKGDPGPWQTALAQGFAALTALPERVRALRGP